MNNVPRVDAECVEAFKRNYVRCNRPVVISRLFHGEPVTKLRTADAACRHIGAMTIKTRPNYFPPQGGDDSHWPRSLDVSGEPLAAFVRQLRKRSPTERICVEFETPSELRDMFRIPLVAAGNEHDTISLLFIAGRGNVAHLHFDTDHRHVLLHQVFGRKRVVVISPSAAPQLAPINATSLLMIEHWPTHVKRRFLSNIKAWDTVLQPGETLYIPPLFWHYVEYPDIAMSFSIRYGRSEVSKFIADRVFPNWVVQNVSSEYLKPRLASKRASTFARIRSVVDAQYPHARAKHSAISAVFAALLQEVCTKHAPLSTASLIDPFESRAGEQFYRDRAANEADSTIDEWRR